MRLSRVSLCLPMVVVLAACVCVTPAFALTALDRPLGDVQAALGKILGCADLDWEISKDDVSCPTRSTVLSTTLDRDSADGTVETIETGGVLEWGDNRIPNQGFLSRRDLHKVFDYLFPQWPQRSAWLDLALCNVMAGKRSTTKVGKLMILVQPELPADLPLIAAAIYVTKRPSVDEWKVDYNGVAPKGRCTKRMPLNR